MGEILSTDRIICVVMLLLAAVYFYATAQIPTLEFGDPLGPKAFPRLLGIVLVIATVMLFVETLRKPKDEEAQPVTADKVSFHHLWIIGGVAVWTALYFFVFERLGYLVSTSVYLLVMTFVFNRGKWLANSITSVLFALGSFVLFVKVLGVLLPIGILGF